MVTQKYGLFVITTGQLIIEREVSDLSLTDWQNYIMFHLPDLKSKLDYLHDVETGNVLAGWTNYDECARLHSKAEFKQLYDKVMGTEYQYKLCLVKQGKKTSLICIEDGQITILKGKVKLTKPYRIRRQKTFKEDWIIKNKQQKFIENWSSYVTV